MHHTPPADAIDPAPAGPAPAPANAGEADAAWWNTVYQPGARPRPFLVDRPDENLLAWWREGHLGPGHVLDVGCGQGRNAMFLARQGCQVLGVDFAPQALATAAERAAAAGVHVAWQCVSVFDLDLPPAQLDGICDSGLFHHLWPAQRGAYIERLRRWLKPGGWLSLVCFRPEGGSGLSDEQVAQAGHLGGGLGYDEAQLRRHWSRGWHIEALRPMHACGPGDEAFGEPFLWALRARAVEPAARPIAP